MWPNARVITVMGAEQAASVLVEIKRDQLERRGEELSEADAELIGGPVRKKYEIEGDPYYGSSLLWDDGVVDPAETRQVVALALSAALNAPIETTRAPVYRM